MKRLFSAAICAACVACLPEDRSGSVDALVYLRDPAGTAYSSGVAPVENLDSLRELRGRDIELRRSSRIEVGLDLAGVRVTVDPGKPFALEYAIDEDGVVIPGDRESFLALSLYRNLDRAASILREHGHEPVRRLQVYYLPRYDNFVAGDGRLVFTDNAAFLPLGRGFIIVPSFLLSDLPLLLNEGVMAHEFGHAVVHQELFGDVDEAPQESSADPGWRIAHRHLSAMHEGVADLIGFAVTGDPDFIGPSLATDRNLAEPRSFLAFDLSSIELLPADALDDRLDPHGLGSIMARTVYEFWPRTEGNRLTEDDRGRLLTLTVRALRALEFAPEVFTLAAFPNELARLLDESERAAACEVLRLRFAPLQSRLTACGGA